MDSNILAEFDLKDIPMTTIDVVRVSVGDNFWEALSIFQAEGNIRPSGELPVGEMHILVGVLVLSWTQTSEKEVVVHGSGTLGA